MAVSDGTRLRRWNTKPTSVRRSAARSRAPRASRGRARRRARGPASGSSSAPARWSIVDLPQPLGPITATSSPGSTRRRHVGEGSHLGESGAVALDDRPQLEGGGGRGAGGVSHGCLRSWWAGGGGAGAQDARLAGVEPAQIGLGAGDEGVGDQGAARSASAGDRIARRRSWSSRVSAVRCRVMTSSAWSGPSSIGEQHLEERARRAAAGRRRATAVHQSPSSSRPGGGDGVALLAVGLVAGHEAVPLQPIEGRVHLPDVEGPRAAGRRLEGGLQLVPVARPLRRAGPGALRAPPWIPSMHTRVCMRQDGACRAPGDPGASPIGLPSTG